MISKHVYASSLINYVEILQIIFFSFTTTKFLNNLAHYYILNMQLEKKKVIYMQKR